jgi:anthraniloyl-CoA monooxygenase
MEDSIALAHMFEQHSEVETALKEYELERRPRVEALQEAAQESRIYFETISRTLSLEPLQFTFHLMSRSGRLGYDNLRQRDPYFVEGVDRWFAASSQKEAKETARLIAPPPLFNPLQLRGLTLANRMVLSPPASYTAVDGLPNETHLAQLRRLALGGAALVLTEPVAVSPAGRITPGDAGIYCADHVAAWAQVVQSIQTDTSAKVAVQLNHAGRRGSTRPRSEGLDRPLRMGNWPLLAASALPYGPQNQTPKAIDRSDMEQVCADFVQAASHAQAAGFDMLHLNFGHGYLLAGFLSPLTNQRTDEYGGSLENRLRFPLELFERVRAAWPADKPLSVALTITDCVAGGFSKEEAVIVAKALKAHGCDLIEIRAGQTTPEANPAYGPGFLTPLSDWLRSKANIATMVGGSLTTTDEINTILAAGRADLGVMQPLLLDE